MQSEVSFVSYLSIHIKDIWQFSIMIKRDAIFMCFQILKLSKLISYPFNFWFLFVNEMKHPVPCHSIIPLLLHATEKTRQNHLYKTVKIKVLMSSFYYLLFFYAFVFIVCIYVRMCTFTNMYIVAMDLVLICPHLSLLSPFNICFK